MRLLKTILPLCLCLAFTFTAHADENGEAAAAHQRGLTVLASGDFDGAIAAFTTAAKADPENKQYRKDIALVSRVKALRGTLPKIEQNEAKWMKMSTSLRSFYLQYEVFGEAVAIDEARFKRFGTPAIAINLAESYLENHQDREAVKTLVALKDGDRTVRGKVMLGIGLARTGKMEEAKALAASVARGDAKDPQLLYDSACLNALIGDLDRASAQLTRCFESIPASSLVTLKRYSLTRADLKALRSDKFASVWSTASKVKSSGCAGCASAATCGSKSEEGTGCDDDKEGGCDEEKEGGCDDDK
jgi:Flp pilus assembly protein TadD